MTPSLGTLPINLPLETSALIRPMDEREEAVKRCVHALASCAYALRSYEAANTPHPDSFPVHALHEAEDALAGMGVSWCRQRGWVMAVRPAGAEPLRWDDRSLFKTGRRAARIAEVLEAGREVPIERVAAVLRDVEALATPGVKGLGDGAERRVEAYIENRRAEIAAGAPICGQGFVGCDLGPNCGSDHK